MSLNAIFVDFVKKCNNGREEKYFRDGQSQAQQQISGILDIAYAIFRKIQKPLNSRQIAVDNRQPKKEDKRHYDIYAQ